MGFPVIIVLYALYFVFGGAESGQWRLAGMDSTPSFDMHVSQAAGSSGASILCDITNIQDEDISLEEEFSDEAINEYLKEAESKGHLSEVIPCVTAETDKENSGKARVPFLELDQDLLQEVREGGISKSEAKLQWARRRFDNWRVHVGISIDKKVEELDVKQFADMLELFMLQVVKLDGSMYPPETLQDLFRRFGCMIRRQQERKIAESGIEEFPFTIKYSVLFTRARLACVAAMRRSRMTAGVCKKRKKMDEISFVNEQAMLADVDHGIQHSVGLQKRILFYCVSRFGIRGQEELELLKLSDFEIGSENGKEFVEYNERLSKQYDVSMDKYQEESFRMPLRVYEEDVILTFKQFVRHYPYADGDENWLFKQAIISPRKTAWYNIKHRVSGRKMSQWLKYMMKLIGVDGSFSGKSGRTTLVSRLSRAGVPLNVGMKVTGHRTPEGFQRYDKTTGLQVKAAMEIAGKPFDSSGSRRMFEDVYKEELNMYDKMQFDGEAQNVNSAVLSCPSASAVVCPSTSAVLSCPSASTVVCPSTSAVLSCPSASAVVCPSTSTLAVASKAHPRVVSVQDNEIEDDMFLNQHWDDLEKQALAHQFTGVLGRAFHNCVFNFHAGK